MKQKEQASRKRVESGGSRGQRTLLRRGWGERTLPASYLSPEQVWPGLQEAGVSLTTLRGGFSLFPPAGGFLLPVFTLLSQLVNL